jgi:hypothetical protein
MAESVIVAALLRGKPGKEDRLPGRLHARVQAPRLDHGVTTYDLDHYESQQHPNRHLENAVLRSFLALSGWFPNCPALEGYGSNSIEGS